MFRLPFNKSLPKLCRGEADTLAIQKYEPELQRRKFSDISSKQLHNFQKTAISFRMQSQSAIFQNTANQKVGNVNELK